MWLTWDPLPPLSHLSGWWTSGQANSWGSLEAWWGEVSDFGSLPEVDGGVEVEVGAGGDVVTREYQVLDMAVRVLMVRLPARSTWRPRSHSATV